MTETRTDPAALSDADLRRAIAAMAGWTKIYGIEGFPPGHHNEIGFYQPIPDYVGSVDVALSLCEGCTIHMDCTWEPREWHVWLASGDWFGDTVVHTNPARAVAEAWYRWMLAQEAGDE